MIICGEYDKITPGDVEMKKRMLYYLDLMSRMDIEAMSEEERKAEAEKLLVQISFFQHERLIHLIVTALFAVLTFMTLMLGVLSGNLYAFVLMGALLILLVPYIKHYYLLENGTQKLYTYYDRLIEKK